MQKQYKRFILVLDDFYEDPYHVRDFAQKLDYHEVENATGFRSNKLFHEKNMKNRLQQLLNIKITRWGKELESENGIFFLAFSKGERKEIPAIHTDPFINDITVVVYLTPGLPQNCGTSFWQHKETSLIGEPTAADAYRLKMKLKELREITENDARKRSQWTEIDRVGYKFNRMVAFPSGVFHSGTTHFGENFQDGRIIQTFRIEVDWSGFGHYKK